MPHFIASFRPSCSDHEAPLPAARAEDPPAAAEGVRPPQAESDEDEDAVLRAQAALAERDAELAGPQVHAVRMETARACTCQRQTYIALSCSGVGMA